MATSEFRYVLTEVFQRYSDANPIIAELPFTGVSFTNQLNSNGTFQGHVLLSGINSDALNAYNGTIPGKTILWVLYADPVSLVSKPVWSGVVWQREYDSTTQTLSISAQEMMSLYERRRISVDKDYSNTFYDPATIAHRIMQYAEALTPNGNTGLQYDIHATGFATKQFYNGYEYKPVYQAVKDLSSGFFDFTIKPYLFGNALINKFIVKNPLGVTYSDSDATSLVLSLPGNLVAYDFPEDASGATNKLYGLGYGANNTKIIATATDPSKTSGTASWPLLEDTASYIDIPDTQLLKDLTLGQLKATSYPPTTVNVILPPYVDPYYPTYSVGDQVRLNIQDAYFPNTLNTVMRIVAISVAPGESGPSRITLTLSRQLSESGIVS